MGAPERIASWRDEPDDAAYGSFRYRPSLDGVRGLAVLAVFLFHADSPLAPGGLLGVSVFFTLSGFLITRLLLDEGTRSAALDLPAFWARRLRRLLPAALAGIAFVLVLAALSALQVDPGALEGDVLGALGYSANWRFLLVGDSYANLFQAPSPLLHYWSLAIEEQFYLFLPLVVWAVLRRSPSALAFRIRLRWVLLVGLALSIATSVVAGSMGNVDFVYYSLPSRAGELLIGGLAATFVTVARLGERKAPPWLTAAGFAALVGVVVLCAMPVAIDGWIGTGGLTAFAVVSATLIVAGTASGPLAGLLAFAPFRLLGIVSYGVYVYHWPVILWLTPERTGLDGSPLVLVQAAVTIGLAVVSYRLLEQPIRRQRALHGNVARVAAPVGIAAMALCGILITSTLSSPARIDFEQAAAVVNATPRTQQAKSALTGVPDAPIVTPPADPAAAPRVAFFGDSTGLATAKGFKTWAATTDDVQMVGGAAWYGCGLVREGRARFNDLEFNPGVCGGLVSQWGTAVDEAQPQIAVIQAGAIEVDDHLLPGDNEWRALGDATLDRLLEQSMLDAVDVFVARGVTPIWLTSPRIEPSRATEPRNDDPSGDPARMRRYNEILDRVARARPALRVIDLASWVEQWPGGEFDAALRPDGVHFDENAAANQVSPWLSHAILREYAQSLATSPTPS